MTRAMKLMSVDEARAYTESRQPDAYTLLDVRQAWEYKEFHLPGALHIPLSELLDRLGEVVQDKPVIAYCLAGGRSAAAASLLDGEGFAEVFSMTGGVMAWRGHTAFGPVEFGVIEFSGRETPQEVVIKAYAMEQKLQEFYLLRADLAESLERIELFMELAGFEDQHMDVLFNHYQRIMGETISRRLFDEVALSDSGGAVEGGVSIQHYLDAMGDSFDEDQGVLQFASMVEAQALDYYLRCARRAEKPEAKEVFETLAREERAHLKLLARFMDRHGEED
ncbi:MAG: rhodanese-like domain-containing protein [Pseudomonadota bacterium]